MENIEVTLVLRTGMKWAVVTLFLGYVVIWQVDQIQSYLIPGGIIILLAFLLYLTSARIEGLSSIKAKVKIILIIFISTGVLIGILYLIIQQQLVSIWLYPPIFAILILSRRLLRKLINLSIEEPSSFGTKSETKQGEIVRSKAEARVANWLYDQDIAYQYEPSITLPDNQSILSDFYLPDHDIYMEYWGLSSSDNEVGEKYRERKREKLRLYSDYNYKLISIYPHHLYELDEYIPQEIDQLTNSNGGILNWLLNLFSRNSTSSAETKDSNNQLFCTNCGNQVTAVGEFCVKCGVEVR